MKKQLVSRTLMGLLMTLALSATVACEKKETPAPSGSAAPAAPAAVANKAPESQATTGTLPPEDNTPFTIPQSAKKQAKYFPDGTPTRAIQDLDDMLDSYIVDTKTPADKLYNERLKRAVIHGTFDVRELCRVALDKHWNDRTPQEQNYFVDLMTRLLEKKAIFSKEQGQKKKKTTTSYQVSYGGHKFLDPQQSTSLAMSSVSIPSQSLKIELNYKLRKVDKGWMIYDVIVDGASLVDNYKYQFDKIIDKEGYPNLVHRMESKLKDLQSKDTEEDVGQ